MSGHVCKGVIIGRAPSTVQTIHSMHPVIQTAAYPRRGNITLRMWPTFMPHTAAEQVVLAPETLSTLLKVSMQTKLRLARTKKTHELLTTNTLQWDIHWAPFRHYIQRAPGRRKTIFFSSSVKIVELATPHERCLYNTKAFWGVNKKRLDIISYKSLSSSMEYGGVEILTCLWWNMFTTFSKSVLYWWLALGVICSVWRPLSC